ncbi:4476_t:CDS:2 [Funneliformis caledonium]|uniref:4476_t:CDS:1 n=1 Tax=Funneliformis caledonium TaxID=1117310 RepID=A0A9N9ACH0_9GLOM|nr:4476_t:CDS:2 [Funneliformis caledonium]
MKKFFHDIALRDASEFATCIINEANLATFGYEILCLLEVKDVAVVNERHFGGEIFRQSASCERTVLEITNCLEIYSVPQNRNHVYGFILYPLDANRTALLMT